MVNILSIKTRQKYLKNLGFYKGDIDGIEGILTKNAYRSLQKKYFVRSSDIDGVYGSNTEKLLRNAERIRLYTKNFKLEEFRCECNGKYCTGYPAFLDIKLLKYAQSLRNRYGAMTITSGLRCTSYNSIIGGIRGSKHTLGKAIDWYSSYSLKSFSNRKRIINWYANNCISMNYSYCDGYARTKFRKEYPSVPSMYKRIHCDVK